MRILFNASAALQGTSGAAHTVGLLSQWRAVAPRHSVVLLSTPEQTELIWEQPTFDFVNRPLDPVRLEAFYTQLQTFIDDVLDGRPPTVPGAEGRAAVEIVEAARRSSESGQAIELPL